MGCCFSRDSSNEEVTVPHRPLATNSFQPYAATNYDITVSLPSVRANSSGFHHAPTSINNSRLARSQQTNQEPARPKRPKTYFEGNNQFQPSVTSSNNIIVSPSLQAPNSNSYYAPTSTRQSRVTNTQCIVSRGYPSHSLTRTVESTLHKSVLKLTVGWDHMNASSEFELQLLLSDTTEYKEILWLFKKTTQKQFMVEKIYRVQNPYLLGCYSLKKEEIQSRYGSVTEEYLFHGTKEQNKDNICRNNFDWRKHGKSVGNIFGQGVSFTPISCYASHYSDSCNTQRMMIVSKVLIAKETVGNKYMKIPPQFDYMQCLRYDTATKENRHVIVKFSDNEFYPTYVIYYTGQYEKKEQKPIRF
ncbi:protein mono-ADP-ribosyltransferase PARP11-like [Schistocerca americana]|uniref:protein mono-ADP-ribosyltransferase PARP11-like n=1 Tax=Schistocerca americana TaxID=7009 RepID=UPI001F4F5138|nr:protein mono-ADP-ribosyltransferase PARP11-like [Schistocerca americana]